VNISNARFKVSTNIDLLVSPKHPKLDFNIMVVLRNRSRCPAVLQTLYSIHVLVTPYGSNNKEGIWV